MKKCNPVYHGHDEMARKAAVCRADKIDGYVVWALAPESLTSCGYWSDPNPQWLQAWERVLYSSKMSRMTSSKLREKSTGDSYRIVRLRSDGSILIAPADEPEYRSITGDDYQYTVNPALLFYEFEVFAETVQA